LNLKKYEEGDFVVAKSDAEGTISEAKTAVDQARREVANMRALYKRGIGQYEPVRQAEQVLKSAEIRLKNAQQKLDSLIKFEYVKQLAEFTGLAEEAEYSLENAKTTAAAKLAQAKDKLKNEKRGLKIQERRLEEHKKSLAKHEMKAPQTGTLTYARHPWRDEKAHVGGTIWQNQNVFVLPDMNIMQVKLAVKSKSNRRRSFMSTHSQIERCTERSKKLRNCLHRRAISLRKIMKSSLRSTSFLTKLN